jgi:hypothetical protein
LIIRGTSCTTNTIWSVGQRYQLLLLHRFSIWKILISIILSFLQTEDCPAINETLHQLMVKLTINKDLKAGRDVFCLLFVHFLLNLGLDIFLKLLLGIWLWSRCVKRLSWLRKTSWNFPLMNSDWVSSINSSSSPTWLWMFMITSDKLAVWNRYWGKLSSLLKETFFSQLNWCPPNCSSDSI